MSKLKNGVLRVWWVPQMPMKSFKVRVPSLKAGVRMMRALARYDLFQFENKIKPDYCNTGGIQVWNASTNHWDDWYDEATGEDDPEQFLESKRS